jgi:hypothetical protein
MNCAAGRVGTLAMLTGLLSASAAIAADPFQDAGTSRQNYSAATVAPRLACRDLLHLPDGRITIVSAETVAAAGDTPAFCRVRGIMAPEMKFEIALPHAWNRRLYMFGNGGYAGEALDAAPRIAVRNGALRHGFATAQTNTGHDAAAEPLATFAGNPQKTIDYATKRPRRLPRPAK